VLKRTTDDYLKQDVRASYISFFRIVFTINDLLGTKIAPTLYLLAFIRNRCTDAPDLPKDCHTIMCIMIEFPGISYNFLSLPILVTSKFLNPVHVGVSKPERISSWIIRKYNPVAYRWLA
jgi:hypothetical protein